MLIGLLALPFIGKIDSEDWPSRWILVAAAVPIAIDGTTQLFGLRESDNTLRIITGAIIGVVLPFYLLQITHRKPRLGGYLSRLPPDYYTIYKSEPVLSDFFAFTGANGTWSGKNFTDEEISHFIRKYNLGYVVFSPNSRQLSFRTEFARQFAQHIERTEEYDGFVLYSIK
jgi:hypothetical protein